MGNTNLTTTSTLPLPAGIHNLSVGAGVRLFCAQHIEAPSAYKLLVPLKGDAAAVAGECARLYREVPVPAGRETRIMEVFWAQIRLGAPGETSTVTFPGCADGLRLVARHVFCLLLGREEWRPEVPVMLCRKDAEFLGWLLRMALNGLEHLGHDTSWFRTEGGQP